MDPPIAKAVVDTAHAQGKPVFAHPQNKTGVEVAISRATLLSRMMRLRLTRIAEPRPLAATH
jgi:hypothetical protein